MITRERLQELIKENKIIWATYLDSNNNNRVHQIRLSDWKIKFDNLGIELEEDTYNCYSQFANEFARHYVSRYSYEQLIESPEEAEFIQNYQGIERTEFLNLPTYEDLQKAKEHFVKIDNLYWLIVDMPHNKDNGRIIMLKNDTLGNTYIVFNREFTRNNYLLACQKAKEIFLGQEKSTDTQ